MTKAFIFGKFLPLHKGHEAMIRFALSQCDLLTVLVCCSDQENIPCNIRKQWIEETFASTPNLEVRIFNYKESELPNTSVSSRIVSEQWSEIFKNQFPDYSIVITSEKYGEYVADFLRIQHLAFDIPKRLYPVSSTAIRHDLFANWKFLPDAVKPYYAVKVIIGGTESTGKSTLTDKLAAHFNCTKVEEAGRDIIENSNSFTIDDLQKVAREHASRIKRAVTGNSPLIIIDTDINTTRSYCMHFFQKELEVTADIEHVNKANLYLYLTSDAEYFQDGTRLEEDERNTLDLSHRQILQDHHIDIVEINGNWEERFKKAIAEIEKLVPGIHLQED